MLWTSLYVVASSSWSSFLVGTYAVGMSLTVGGFSLYHVLLYFYGMTTREHLQNNRSMK
jgi:hypothetical protein